MNGFGSCGVDGAQCFFLFCFFFAPCHRCRLCAVTQGCVLQHVMGDTAPQVSLPEEKHDGQSLHIRRDLMPGCISLDLPRWMLLCPTYCSQPASQPAILSPSPPLSVLAPCLQGTLGGWSWCSTLRPRCLDRLIVRLIDNWSRGGMSINWYRSFCGNDSY